MPAPHPRLDRSSACILIVDAQEKLAQAMPLQTLERLVKYGRALIGAAREMDLPVLASEQYPKGLGPTIPALRNILPQAPFAKMHFSCCADPAFLPRLAATGRKQVIVAGMETHVCIFQTTRDLVAQGYEVHVCADAVVSRTEEHRRVGLELCRESGAIVTTAETAIFDLLHEASTATFKKVVALVK